MVFTMVRRSDHSKIFAAKQSLTLPFCCWTETSRSFSVRTRWTSGGISSNPLTTPPTWSTTFFLMRELSGKRSSPPPNMTIAFDRKIHFSPKAIAKAFNRQFSGSFVQEKRTLRKLIREVRNQHLVVPNYRPFDEWGITAS